MLQQLSILGSTGSIGVQTLDIVRDNPELFSITSLAAGKNYQLLANQAKEFRPKRVAISDKDSYRPLYDILFPLGIEVLAGEDAISELAGDKSVDMVVNAIVGYAGLQPTLAAIRSSRKLALANKESLVVAGEMVMQLAREKGVEILPIDSEHSAIFQCLQGENSPVRRLIITCSGGAFRDFAKEDLQNVTPQQALRHPQWQMGAKITIDSSTLVNKGFEVIEARWLFDMPSEKIYVIQHEQSVVHSMVEFEDGAIKAQLGTPDMHVPISVALMYPKRAVIHGEEFSFVKNPQLTFKEIDRDKYPALDIAYDCLRRGGTLACAMNGANEVAVGAFLSGRCRYLDIVGAIRHAIEHCDFIGKPSEEDYAEINRQSRQLAKSYLRL
ncbi:MAG: 1-deoxy-D-xylulose-5-phosphate reductoisomerase [Alistipes sp.]|nr:1-deoxy-D-xylulose-5-phosphate reductoisomerase [Candidatus Alistipes equi]